MKRILFLLIFSSVLINCSSSLKPISPSQYSKKEIDKKFPYFRGKKRIYQNNYC